MKKYVFTIKDDVCAANNKDVNAVELIGVMQHYGIVEDYDKVTASIANEYQSSIDGLTRQLTAIKDQELTDDEIAIVKAYRTQKANTVASYKAVAESYAAQLQDVKKKHEDMNSKIKAILGEE